MTSSGQSRYRWRRTNRAKSSSANPLLETTENCGTLSGLIKCTRLTVDLLPGGTIVEN